MTLHSSLSASFSIFEPRLRVSVVLEFQPRAASPDQTISLLVNDQPLFSVLDLHRADFRSF
jgi:hypothetical protein